MSDKHAAQTAARDNKAATVGGPVPFEHESGGWFRPPDTGIARGALVRIVQRLLPGHALGDALSKPWTETAIPLLLLVILTAVLSLLLDSFMTAGNMLGVLRQVAEMGLILLGMTLVVIVGGIDLSIGAIYAITNFTALYFIQYIGLPAPLAVLATLAAGAVLGAFNGILIGYLRLRAFLTTLISLIIFRGIYDILILKYGAEVAAGFPDSPIWDYLAFGSTWGLSPSIWIFIILAVAFHLFLTRFRVGWHVYAIGGSRRAAHNAGIPVRRTVMLCYVGSGILTALSAVFFAARFGTTSYDIGVGLEFIILTAVVVGGITLGGGRGTVTKAVVGLLIVLFLINGMTSMSAPSGVVTLALGVVLILAAVLDIVWNERRRFFLGGAKIRPSQRAFGRLRVLRSGADHAWELNDRLGRAELLMHQGMQTVEDVVVNDDGDLFAASRKGDIIRFRGPDFKESEVFAHVGGHALALASGKDGELFGASAGIGIFRIDRDGTVETISVQTNRSRFALHDDSRLKFAGDLALATDGRVLFSESSTRFDASEVPFDLIEAGGTGRILISDPKSGATRTLVSGLHHPDGVALGPDGESILFALTTDCAVRRYWFDGPSKGKVVDVVTNLPGHPENINPSSDGNYWVAIGALRSPVTDIALSMPDFRSRMARALPTDEWLIPQVNRGCVAKISPAGEIMETLWDARGDNFPTIASVREYDGWLYVVCSRTNRIGRVALSATEKPCEGEADA